VIDSLGLIFTESIDAQNARRGFVVTGDESYLEPYLGAVETVPVHLERLRELTADNVDQQARVVALKEAVERGFVFGRQVIDARQEDGFNGARALMLAREGTSVAEEIRRLIREMKSTEERLLQERESLAAQSATLAQSVIIVGSIIAFAVIGLTSIGMRRNLAGRLLAEQGLRRSEESLSVTLNSIGDAVLATDTSGKIIRMNPVAEKLTGWRQDDALNRPIGDVFRIINENTRAPVPIPVDRVLGPGRSRREHRTCGGDQAGRGSGRARASTDAVEIHL
jgi:CHASE3 domain sensor protein